MKKTRRSEALRLYLSRMGNISFSEIAGIVGANRSTVGRWARVDEWTHQLAEVKGRTSMKIADNISADVASIFDADLAQARRIGEIIEAKLSGADKSIAVSEIRALTDALERKVKIVRLLSDQSTSNRAVAVKGGSPTGEPGHNKKSSFSNFDRRMQQIAETGDVESQEKLYEIARLMSELNAPMPGEA